MDEIEHLNAAILLLSEKWGRLTPGDSSMRDQRPKTIGRNDATEAVVCDDGSKLIRHSRKFPDDRGKMAMQFAIEWGMVAGIHDGEDSAGRSRVRLSTPDEVVTRAVEMADKLYAAIQARGWFLDLPSFEDAVRQPDEPTDAIHALRLAKEAAVAEHDFETAAKIRDFTDRLTEDRKASRPKAELAP